MLCVSYAFDMAGVNDASEFEKLNFFKFLYV